MVRAGLRFSVGAVVANAVLILRAASEYLYHVDLQEDEQGIVEVSISGAFLSSWRATILSTPSWTLVLFNDDDFKALVVSLLVILSFGRSGATVRSLFKADDGPVRLRRPAHCANCEIMIDFGGEFLSAC